MVKIRHGFIFIDLVSVGSRHCHTKNTISLLLSLRREQQELLLNERDELKFEKKNYSNI